MKISRKSMPNPLDALKKKKVNVGWFESSKYENGMPVAGIAYRNEFGDMGNKQPPRPFMRTAIKESNNRWSNTAKKVTQDIIKGSSVDTSLNLLGVVVHTDIQKSITKLTAPALSETTIKIRKWKVAKGRKIASSINKPLVDTGYELTTLTSEVS